MAEDPPNWCMVERGELAAMLEEARIQARVGVSTYVEPAHAPCIKPCFPVWSNLPTVGVEV